MYTAANQSHGLQWITSDGQSRPGRSRSVGTLVGCNKVIVRPSGCGATRETWVCCAATPAIAEWVQEPVSVQSLTSKRVGHFNDLISPRLQMTTTSFTPHVHTPRMLPHVPSAPEKRHDQDAEAVERDVHVLSERLAAMEHERNMALNALRQSESELQVALARETELREALASQQEQAKEDECTKKSADVQFHHYRVLIELLTVRCRLLEQWLEEEATARSYQESGAHRALVALEEQTATLGASMVEQQRIFKMQLKAEQEHLARELVAEQERLASEGAAELSALEDDFRQREEAWLQQWASLQCNTSVDDLCLAGALCANPWDSGQDCVGLASILEVPEEECPRMDQDHRIQEPFDRERHWFGRAYPDMHEVALALPEVTLQEIELPQVNLQEVVIASPVAALASPEVALASPSTDVVSNIVDADVPIERESGFEQCWRPNLVVHGFVSASLPRGEGTSGVTFRPLLSAQSARESANPPSLDHFVHGGDMAVGVVSSTSSQPSSESVPAAPREDASNTVQAARSWARAGQVHQRKKNFAEARAAYNTALQLDSSQHGCLANLAQLEAHAGNTSAAQELVMLALQLDPANSGYLSFKRWLQGSTEP